MLLCKKLKIVTWSNYSKIRKRYSKLQVSSSRMELTGFNPHGSKNCKNCETWNSKQFPSFKKYSLIQMKSNVANSSSKLGTLKRSVWKKMDSVKTKIGSTTEKIPKIKKTKLPKILKRKKSWKTSEIPEYEFSSHSLVALASNSELSNMDLNFEKIIIYVYFVKK